MKDFFVYRFALRLTLPFIVVVCVLVGGTTPALAAKKARVQIGFQGVQVIDPNTQQPIFFQNVLLNVIGVRINPHAGAAPNSGSWNRIPAPPGIGGSSSLGELQIDLNASQNLPQLFRGRFCFVKSYFESWWWFKTRTISIKEKSVAEYSFAPNLFRMLGT